MIKEITEGSTLSREELIEEMKKKREEYNGLLTRRIDKDERNREKQS